jgi:hypothetical protein
MRVTEKRREIFLAELAEHGVVVRAARAASPHSTSVRGALTSFRDLRAKDPEFRADWDTAVEQARGRVEHELHRRAVEGWDEPIYGGRYKEQVVGHVRRYSDRLLELRAKALLPDYRDRSHVDLGGGLSVHHSRKAMDDLASLTQAERDQLRAMVERVAAREAEQ